MLNILEPSGHRLPSVSQDCTYSAPTTILSRHQDIANGSSAISSSRGEPAARGLGAARLKILCQRLLQKLKIDVGGSVVTESIGGGGDPAVRPWVVAFRDMNIDDVHIGLDIRCAG